MQLVTIKSYESDLYVWQELLDMAGRQFSLGSPVSSTNKTDPHNINEIMLSGIKHQYLIPSIKLVSLIYTCGKVHGKVYLTHAVGLRFILGSPVSSIKKKTDHHNITEILLKVALNKNNSSQV